MTENRCPNCAWKPKGQPVDTYFSHCGNAKCDLPVNLWPKWRSMREVCESIETCRHHENVALLLLPKARRALGRRG